MGISKKSLMAIVAIFLIVIGTAHWYYSDRGRFTTPAVYTDLSRSVQGNDLISEQDPAAILRFHESFQYLGGQKFILYGNADTEQHFFVTTTPDDKIQSLYWVQYEAYLPGKGGSYDYDDSPLRVTLGDYEFFTDTAFVSFDPDRKRKAGTDGARARQFLAQKGFILPLEFAYARMVYLTDESKRKEVLVIFIDNLAGQGVTAEQIKTNGKVAEFEQRHLDRVRETLVVLPVPSS